MKKLFDYIALQKKYNSICNRLEVAREDNERLIIKYDTERRIHKIRRDVWEETLKAQEQEIIDLKQKMKKRKKESDKNEK